MAECCVRAVQEVRCELGLELRQRGDLARGDVQRETIISVGRRR